MTDLFTTLDKIKQSPGLYLGHPSISDRSTFLIGHEFARTELGQAPSEAENYFYENWGCKKYSASPASRAGQS